VTSPGSVESDERLRLFCGLRLPDDAVARLTAWQGEHLPGGGRIVPPANLHVTLAFLGHRPRHDLEAIAEALRGAAAAADAIELEADRYREGRSVGMLVLRDESGAATRLADDVQGRLETLGVYRREARAWLPHLTVLRFRERPRLRPPVPSLGRVRPSEAAAFLSRPRPGGAEYVVLESVRLGGT
jgi:RNA 2',3'-cyclic 3'-phosphodiesterase